MAKNTLISVVVPVYNESGNISEVFDRLQDLFRNRWPRQYEILFIDDGSNDGTTELLKLFPDRDPNVRVLRFLRNFGQQAAVTAGFEYSRGEIVVVMDADLQVDPYDIPKLVEKMEEGYDIVAGYRKNRPEGFITRRLPSIFANRFFSFLLGVQYRDMGCGLQAYRKQYLEGPDQYNPMYGHAAIFAVWRGGRFIQVPVSFNPRRSGQTKYSWLRLVAFFLDILITFSMRPIQLTVFFLLGIVFGIASVVLLSTFAVIWPFGYTVPTVFWVMALFFGLAGLQFITSGIQYERLNRINNRIQQNPVFVIDEIIENPPVAKKEYNRNEKKSTEN